MSGHNYLGGDLVMLRCDGDKRTLKANKTVLAKHSKYFQGTITFAEGEVTFDPKIVAFDVLDKLVKYMETGTFKPTMDDAEQLFYAADYLQVEGALSALVEFLHTEANRQMKDLENTPKEYILIYLRLYSQFRRYETKENFEHATLDIGNMIKGNRTSTNVIRPVCIKFLIAVHFKKVINELPILEMEEDHLFELLSSDDLRISEEDVLRTIKMWCFYNLEARRDSFPKMVRCLRVDKSMTSKYILDELTCHCKVQCECLTSNDFVISLLSHQLNTAYKEEKGPLKRKQRARHSYLKG